MPGLARVAESGNPVVAVRAALHLGEALFDDGNARDVALDVVLGVRNDAHGFQDVGNGLPEGGHVVFRLCVRRDGNLDGALHPVQKLLSLRAVLIKPVLNFVRIKTRSGDVLIFLNEGHVAHNDNGHSDRRSRRERHCAAVFRKRYGAARRDVGFRFISDSDIDKHLVFLPHAKGKRERLCRAIPLKNILAYLGFETHHNPLAANQPSILRLSFPSEAF